MARAVWKGAISFGLVHVPVELYAAESRNEFKFTMLDRRDLAPVGYQRASKRLTCSCRVSGATRAMRCYAKRFDVPNAWVSQR